MKGLLLLVAATLSAQNLRPLHLSPGGMILDDSGKPVVLRGVNRSGTGSGNADAIASDADYATQNRLLSMNVVRLFVNAQWWNTNVTVPIANQKYQDYIDSLIQRAKKYGNYVLAVKAGQFPDPPCGADAKNCPADQQPSSANIDIALVFWSSFARKYAAEPAVLYDTFEAMNLSDPNAWLDNQDQLIATIRTYAPQSLIFVEDAGAAFESIAAGNTPDLSWPSIVWGVQLFNASAAGCTEPASPRSANWPQNLNPVVSYAQQHGHGAAITEWGGCNDAEPYHTNITTFAKTHSVALVYFDSSNLINATQLTATGQKVAQAFTALATAGPAPTITLVANAEGDAPLIAPNTWVEIKGTNLAPAGDGRIWEGSDFFFNQLPVQLDGVSVTVNGKTAYVYYVSPVQINILTPPDAMLGMVPVQVTTAGVTSAPMMAEAKALSPSFFVFNGGPYLAARHIDGSYLGPATLFPGLTTPAKPGEIVELFANGFGPTSNPIVSGSLVQSGTLFPLPSVTIGGVKADVSFAGLILPGEFQFNVTIPASLADGDHAVTCTYNGVSTQAGTLITVKR